MVIVASSDAEPAVSLEARGMIIRMRNLMDADICEYTMADLARSMNDAMNAESQETFEEAWSAMGSKERRAWKRLLVHRRPRG